MCEGVGTRVDDEVDDHLWNDFESCAQSVTLLYRNPTWKALQKAAASTTQLYKSGLEREKKSFDKGAFMQVDKVLCKFLRKAHDEVASLRICHAFIFD